MSGTGAQLDLLAPHEADEEFVVRRSRRAHRLSVTVSAYGSVQVVVPQRVRATEVERFVSAHREWIDNAVAELRRHSPPAEIVAPDRIELAAIGCAWDVRYDMRKWRAGTDTLDVPARRDDLPAVRRYLQRWLQRTARAHFVPRLEQISARTGLVYNSVQVRGQRTRWGSCSERRTISINYCLLFLRPAAVDYLFVHELCHTRVMDHSRRFWALVARHEPGYRELERELDRAWRDVPRWVGIGPA